MEALLRKPQTITLVRTHVRSSLLRDFPDEGLDAADAAVKVVYEDCFVEILESVATWAITKENYTDAVDRLARLIHTKAKAFLASIPKDPSHLVVEREFRRDQSFY